MSTQSISNNYNTPLIAAASFVGLDESSSDSLTLSVFLASPTLGLLTIKQSNTRGGPYQLTDTFNYGTVDTMEVYRVPSGFSFFHVEFSNAEGNQTYLSLNTYLERTFQETSVTIDGGTVSVTNIVDISGSVLTTEKVTQVGSKGNLLNATFNPLAQTNIFNCSGYAESTLTYQDSSPANTGDMLIFVRVDGSIADSEVCIGKLIAVTNANATNRYASTTLNLRGFNAIFVQNNSTTNTNTNCIISLFSY
jgi:hypothetical protein